MGYTIFLPSVFAPGPPVYDMSEYIIGDPSRFFRVDNSWGSSQVHNTQPGNLPGLWYQVKDREWEELYTDDQYIYRGVDVSMGEGRHYILRDSPDPEDFPTGRFSKWSPRLWSPGDLFYRSPILTVYEADCSIIINQTVPTWLKFAEWVPTWQKTLTNDQGEIVRVGAVLEDVIILHWLQNAEDVQPLETYYYCKGYGLIGFGDGSKPGGLQSWVSHVFQPGELDPAPRIPRPCH